MALEREYHLLTSKTLAGFLELALIAEVWVESLALMPGVSIDKKKMR